MPNRDQWLYEHWCPFSAQPFPEPSPLILQSSRFIFKKIELQRSRTYEIYKLLSQHLNPKARVQSNQPQHTFWRANPRKNVAGIFEPQVSFMAMVIITAYVSDICKRKCFYSQGSFVVFFLRVPPNNFRLCLKDSPKLFHKS